MATHLHFVFRRHRNDALEEVRDSSPILVSADFAGQRWFVLVLILLEDELAVGRQSASLRSTGARNADDREVVLHREDAGPRAVADLRADVLDVFVAIGAREKDRGHLRALNRR